MRWGAGDCNIAFAPLQYMPSQLAVAAGSVPGGLARHRLMFQRQPVTRHIFTECNVGRRDIVKMSFAVILQPSPRSKAQKNQACRLYLLPKVYTIAQVSSVELATGLGFEEQVLLPA